MGYIYLFTNSDHKKYTGIGYAEDWNTEFKRLNRDPNNLGTFSCDCIYEVTNKTDYDSFLDIVITFLPKARIKKNDGRKTNYYDIPIKDVRRALNNFASERGSGLVTKNPTPSEDKSGSKPGRVTHEPKIINTPSYEGRLNKSEALDYILSKGYKINKGNCTFASKNKMSPMYWANPYFGRLDSDWTIVLDDTVLRKYYLLEVKGGTIKKDELVARSDMPHKIQLTLKYGDPDLVDTTSGYTFGKFKVAEIDYPNSDDHD